ncbi:MAG TPA: AraC family ligand binding domain-containing protein [Pyrinomonadaceae bacterium]
MGQQEYEFVDRTGFEYEKLRLIPAVIIPKERLETEIERLASLPSPANGRRASLIASPKTGIGNGLTYTTAVSLCVLLPGEKTKPIRHNSSLVDFCIHGGGSTLIDGRRVDYNKYDLWTTTPWSIYQHFNDTDELQVRLSYSNSALLEKLGVHIVDEDPGAPEAKDRDESATEAAADPAKTNPFGTFQLTDDGAFLMPYEKLINPDHLEIKSLHWPWERVKAELDKLRALGKTYVGRRLYLMYDPATGRTNGTTHTFFATITIRPANIVDRPHRHVSAAINYYFQGSGYSTVEGQRYEWKAGDLMLSAPGWAVHNHASNNEDVYELTIQDQPMHLALGSLLWHEDLRGEPRLLGLRKGFATNRSGFTEVGAGK